MKIIKSPLFAFGLAVLVQVNSAAAASNEKQLLILETAENIEFVGEEIAKAYFYKGLGIRASVAKRNLADGVAGLDKDLKILESMSLKADEKNLLVFFSMTRDDIKDVLSQPYSLENGALMLDFSATLLEGAEEIAKNHRQLNNINETLLVDVERMEFLLERINKYYIAHYAGIKDEVNVTQLRKAVAEFEVDLKEISNFQGYHASQQTSLRKIKTFWPIAKRFFLGIEQGSLPVIVLASSSSLERELEKLKSFFHKEALKK